MMIILQINFELFYLLLTSEDFLNIYEAALPLDEQGVRKTNKNQQDQVSSFKKQLEIFLSGRTWHFRQRVCPCDSIFVFERALNLKFDVHRATFDIREGFFDQLIFAPIQGGYHHDVPKVADINDPMVDHYRVKPDYLVHWFIKNGFPYSAIYILRQRPVMCTFGYAPSWENRTVGKSLFTLVFEQNSIRPEEKGRLIEEIEKAMRDSCLEL